VVFFLLLAHETAGAARTRHSLRPRSRGARLPKQSSGDQRRETVKPYLPFEIRINERGRGQGGICAVATGPQKAVGRASAEVRGLTLT
ncbi:hypothetical protein, partial [Bradyrhizobium sp.]|uniref:hypothetical protein n=1 Tax=Bradyrhizobium sp. TaxID=376 RepID=UPI003C5DA9FE